MGFDTSKVKNDVTTQWNSTLQILEKLLKIKDALIITLSSGQKLFQA